MSAFGTTWRGAQRRFVQRSGLLPNLERPGVGPLQNTRPSSERLQGGNAYAVGNPFGNVPIVWPNLNQDKYPFYNNGVGTPISPAIYIDPNNRPGRVFTWSLAVQHTLTKDLVVEIAYVGNRSAYFPAPQMSQIAQNTVTPDSLKALWGIDMNKADDRALLTQQMSSTAVQARFPQFSSPVQRSQLTVPTVYKGFPRGQQ